MAIDFLKSVNKDLEKAGIVGGSSEPPRYWFSTGNYVLNKIISGSFYKGIPQGRIISLSGPSGAGKSFLAANIIREAQKEKVIVVVLDSENALDDDFVKAVGVDPTLDEYMYFPVETIPQVKKIVSKVLDGYKKEYGDDPEAPKMLFVIDSLDMLLTETEEEQFAKGVTKGDQGQRNKQLKAMLRSFVQHIKRPNVSMVVTNQVYKNQDILNGEGKWIISAAVKFSLSQIILLTKLKLKESGSSDVSGIRMKCEGNKTRFTKPFQTVTIEVPYDTGMDPYNGLLDVAVELGVCSKKGSRYVLNDGTDGPSFYSKDFHNVAEKVLEMCEAKREKFLDAITEDFEEDMKENVSAKTRRKAKVATRDT